MKRIFFSLKRRKRSGLKRPARIARCASLFKAACSAQVWEEEYDDFDDVPARKRKKKRGNGTGCLIGIIIVLLLVIVVFALGWIVFPNQKDEILSQIGLGPTATPTAAPTGHADA